MNITYTTDDPGKEYVNAIRRAKTVEALVEAILPYKRVADDALDVAKKMTSEDFRGCKSAILNFSQKSTNLV